LGKASNPKLFQTQKRSILFLFLGPFPSGVTWFWKLGNFSPFSFWKQETGNQRSRTGPIHAQGISWSFSHKSRLILKENSPCVKLFCLNEVGGKTEASALLWRHPRPRYALFVAK
jgi:hypothetical protein